MLHVNSDQIVWSAPDYQRREQLSYSIAANIREIQEWRQMEIDAANFRSYKDNWDGSDGVAPDARVVNSAVAFLYDLRGREDMPAPGRVSLSPEGSIAFDWLQGPALIRAELSEPERVSWMIAVPGKPTTFGTEVLRSPQPTAFGSEPASAVTASTIDRGQEWQPAAPAVDVPALVAAH
jgi:hypothetical protein